MLITATNRPNAASCRALAWLGVLIPLMVIALAIGGYLLFKSMKGEGSGDDQDSSQSESLKAGSDIYLAIRTIELHPEQPGGKAWDRLDKSGPDIDFEINWQGSTVFEAKQRGDTLIGSWDTISLDVKSAVLSGKVGLGDSIEAAIIRVENDGVITLRVWDNDVTGTDPAGKIEFGLRDLKLGDNTFEYEKGEDNAIKRVVVRVIDKSLPIKELVDQATSP